MLSSVWNDEGFVTRQECPREKKKKKRRWEEKIRVDFSQVRGGQLEEMDVSCGKSGKMVVGSLLVLFCCCLMTVRCEHRNCLTYEPNTSSLAYVSYEDTLHACVSCMRDTREQFRRHSTTMSQIFDVNDPHPCCVEYRADALNFVGGEEMVRNCSDPVETTKYHHLNCHNNQTCSYGIGEANATSCEYFTCNTSINGIPSGISSVCHNKDKICDGVKDCMMGEDEISCSWHRGTCDGFLCPQPHPECIPLHKVCDGSKDCVDGADEKNCHYCPRQFRCGTLYHNDTGVTSAECYNVMRICDGVEDCNNGQDEQNCYRWSEWSTWSPMTCHNHTAPRTRNRSCVDSQLNDVGSDSCRHLDLESNESHQNESCIQPTTATSTATAVTAATLAVLTTTQQAQNITTKQSAKVTESSSISLHSEVTHHLTTVVSDVITNFSLLNGSTTMSSADLNSVSTAASVTTELLKSTNTDDDDDDESFPFSLSEKGRNFLIAISIFLFLQLAVIITIICIAWMKRRGTWSPSSGTQGELPMTSYTNHTFKKEDEKTKTLQKSTTRSNDDSAYSEVAELETTGGNGNTQQQRETQADAVELTI